METVMTPAARYTLRDDGILEAEHLPGAERTTADLVPEQMEAIRRLIGDTPRPALWKTHGAMMTDVSAWRLWIEKATSFGVAVAILHDAQRDEPLPSFVGAANSMLFPVETFTDEDEAIEWLSGFVKPSE